MKGIMSEDCAEWSISWQYGHQPTHQYLDEA